VIDTKKAGPQGSLFCWSFKYDMLSAKVTLQVT